MYPRFEKVSYEQFYESMSEIIDTEYKDELIKSAYESLSIPQRATKGSAGYDFKAPFTFTLEPGKELSLSYRIYVLDKNINATTAEVLSDFERD